MENEIPKTNVSNIRTLTEDLINVYNQVRNKEITSRDANDVANVAGKILNAAKAELGYLQWLKEKKRIPFFEPETNEQN